MAEHYQQKNNLISKLIETLNDEEMEHLK